MSFSFGFEPDEPMAAAEYGQWISKLLERAPIAYHDPRVVVENDVLAYVRALEQVVRVAEELHTEMLPHDYDPLWSRLGAVLGELHRSLGGVF